MLAASVRRALAKHGAVVALETTLVTHGLPRDEGLRTAAALEAEVASGGALPATIGVLDGAIRVGLTPAELRTLAGSAGVAKLGLSNFAARLANGGAGATTVAATMMVAAHVGIEVFATGGIGGVHRGASETGDVSADLTALARYPVAVVCSGAKAVLDLSKTVEMLETLGVPVFGWRTASFPAFYRRDSGLPVDAAFESMAALAAAIRAHWALGGAGVLVANPVAAEHEMPADVYEAALAWAHGELTTRSLRGRDVTPFLLERVRELTEGRSVFTNQELLKSNARVAGELAAALAGCRPAKRKR